jgi:RHS repeat-associated core domain
MTDANYGEGSGLAGNQHLQDEFFRYDKMGNVMSIYRKNGGNVIDDLTFHYNGNQLQTVDDAIPPSDPHYGLTEYTNYSTGVPSDFLYDTNGNLTEDLDKNIVKINYNVLNLPDVIQFRNGNQVINTYNAAGHKLRTKYYTTMRDVNVPVGTIHGDYNADEATLRLDDYCGSVLYENGTSESVHPLTKLLTSEGYVDYATSGHPYCYYKQDHLGSNREVTSYMGTTGTVVQKTQFYPSGTAYQTIAGDGAGVQPYKFTGKELITMHGLNWQDYGARWLDNVRMQWTSVDPLAEKYYSISPYAYCAGNPVKFIDSKGKDIDIWYPTDNGGVATFRFNGSNADQAPNNAYVQDFLTAYNYDTGNGGGDNLKEAATNNKLSINVSPSWVGSDNIDYYSLNENTVHWDSHRALRSVGGLRESPATILEHEMDHAVAANKDVKSFIDRINSTNEHGNAEEDRVMGGSERKTAICNGEIKKNQKRVDHYNNILYPVANPTSTNPDYVNRSAIETINYWLSVNPNIQITVK